MNDTNLSILLLLSFALLAAEKTEAEMCSQYEDEDHTELFHKYRPRYPKKIFEIIDRKLTESTDRLPNELREKYKKNDNGRWREALDIGCGTGISTLMLVDFVQESFGIDSSKTQIFKAKVVSYGMKDPSRVTYLNEDALMISQMFSENSIDLIVSGQAVHWLADRAKFYEACMKVLRPGGLLALYGYRTHEFEDENAEKIKQEFCPGMTKDFEPKEVKHLDNSYKDIFEELKTLYPNAERDDSFTDHLESTIDHYAGYLSSWCAYRNYKKVHPGHPDILDDVRDKLKEIFPGDTLVKTTAKYFILFVTKEV
ncbi:hypothetical protein HELRODRAFT_154744 [Helobdella robusta]|uniref:Methyltransferase type 11 domain-containing protein n=1 Tax=Helobdella robusta TaxID=6412 RepID=T1ELF9_HELRO|nr:hypothetical protein HELRODRAFT_154744 [Helobdella robusta]ESO04637.1 hypothetical protein HELRODRAFT_154744 [Helobdella robusta]